MHQTRKVTIRDQELIISSHCHSVFYEELNREREIYDFIDSLTTDDTFVDVGAAGGRCAIYAASKGITTHAYEPEQLNFKILQFHKDINNLDNLFLHQQATGATHHQAGIINNLPAPGAPCRFLTTSRGRKDIHIEGNPTHLVDVITLDSVDHDCSAIKIDVDGSEYETLQGAQALLKSPALRQIIIELHSKDEHFDYMSKLITGAGYSLKQKNMVANYGLYNYWFSKDQSPSD